MDIQTQANISAEDCDELHHQGKRLNEVTDQIVDQLGAFKTQ